MRTAPAVRTRVERGADALRLPRCSPMWSSIISAESSSAVGFARFLSAMSGALPCTASKTAAVECRCWRPGTTPRPPTRPAQRSDTMSPYRFGSTQHVELLRVHHQLHARGVDDPLVVGDVDELARHLARALEEQAVAQLHDVGLVDRRDRLRRLFARAYSNANSRDARRRLLGDDLEALDHARDDLVLEAGVEVLGVLADDDQVDVREAARARRAGCVTGRRLAYRSSALRSPTFTLVKPSAIGVVTGPFSATLFSRIESSSADRQRLAESLEGDDAGVVSLPLDVDRRPP